jgi:hypothetical protein
MRVKVTLFTVAFVVYPMAAFALLIASALWRRGGVA